MFEKKEITVPSSKATVGETVSIIDPKNYARVTGVGRVEKVTHKERGNPVAKVIVKIIKGTG